MAKRILTHPCIISCTLGLALMLTGVKLPAAVLAPVRALAQCNTAGSMMVVGMILARIEPRSFRDGSVYRFSLHRLVLMPALFWLLLRFLPVDPMVFKISVLLTAMPAGATTSILAEKYGADSEYATKLVVISTLLSIPTVFLWTLLLG
jgi:predicted permease